MAYNSEQEIDRAGKQLRTASRLRRRVRERRDRQEGESWMRSDSARGVAGATSPTTRKINANERDAARLRKSREQVRKGEVHWGVEDSEETPKTDAGG